MPTIAERFDRLVRLGICDDTADNRALFASGFGTVLTDLLMAQPEQRDIIGRQLWDQLNQFFDDSERNSTLVRQRFAEIRRIVADAGEFNAGLA